MGFFEAGREEGGSFDYGIEAVVQRILADPEFIYRRGARARRRRAGIALRDQRSRAGFAPLVLPLEQHSGRGAASSLRRRAACATPKVLEQQVERMIADPRSEAFVENFTGQWLNVRGMQASEPVVDLFPDFDSTLRQAFRREIELFFGSVIHEDRSILDLLTADYTFVNERLAKHYGIPDVYGAQFRRVTLGPELDMRRGLLGKGALLTITSDAARTLAGQARQVVPGNVPRHQPARSAAGRRNGSEARRGRGAENAAGAARGASHQPELRRVPSELRADGARHGELRRRRRVADVGCRPTDRSHGRHERRDAARTASEPARIRASRTAMCSRNP